jgi:hypothetical protein
MLQSTSVMSLTIPYTVIAKQSPTEILRFAPHHVLSGFFTVLSTRSIWRVKQQNINYVCLCKY